MKEQWKTIEGFEDYEVSTEGNIRRKGKEENLKPWDESHGYASVSLFKDKKKSNKKVHRIVALAWCKNPEKKPEVNHINHQKKDNRASNLEWVTSSENTRSMLKTTGNANQFTVFPKVAQYNTSGVLIKKFESPLEAAKLYEYKTSKGKFDARGINDCCRGYKRTYKGFIWTYYDVNEPEIKKYEVQKKIAKYTLTGDLIESYKDQHEAAIKNGIYNSRKLPETRGIRSCCEGTWKKYKNFQWKYFETEPVKTIEDLTKTFAKGKQIICYDEKTKEIKIFNSIKETSKVLKVTQEMIRETLKKETKQYKNFIFKAVDGANGECLENMSNFKEERRVKSKD